MAAEDHRKTTSKDAGYVPATYVKEIEPATFQKEVTEKVTIPEKVKVKKKKTKTVYVTRERPVERKRSIRKSPAVVRRNRSMNKRNKRTRFTQHFDRENVTNRQLAITVAYSKLKTAAEDRRNSLKKAIKYFQFCLAQEDLVSWIKNKVKYLTRIDAGRETVDIQSLQRMLEKIDTELVANEKTLLELEQAADELIVVENSMSDDVNRRKQTTTESWEKLVQLRKLKEEELKGKHGVEMFMQICDEALKWMAEKSNTLSDSIVDRDLEAIRTMQRKHQNFERDLAAIEVKINEIEGEGQSLQKTHPAAASRISQKENHIKKAWNDLRTRASRKKSLLEESYGQQGFVADCKEMFLWANQSTKRLSLGEMPKDLHRAEDLIQQNKQRWSEIEEKLERLHDLISYGEKLMTAKPSAVQVRKNVEQLRKMVKGIPHVWKNRQHQLEQCKKYLVFMRDAEHFDAITSSLAAILATDQDAESVEHANTLLKQHDETEAKVSQQDKNLKALCLVAEDSSMKGHQDYLSISKKKNEIITNFNNVISQATKRKERLLSSRSFQQFRRDVEEFMSWSTEKLCLTQDTSYMDSSNLQRKVLKNQALQAEIIANEQVKEKLDEEGQEMIEEDHFASEDIYDLLETLDSRWNYLEEKCKEKNQRLDEETKKKAFDNSLDDLEIWAEQMENILSSEDFGDDLGNIKFLLNKHQLQENELKARKQDFNDMQLEGASMIENGHYVFQDIASSLERISGRMQSLSGLAESRKRQLDRSLSWQQFLFDINIETGWIQEHQSQAENKDYGSSFTDNERFIKRHVALQTEIKNHLSYFQSMVGRSRHLSEKYGISPDVVEDKCSDLSELWENLQKSCEHRKQKLTQTREAFKYLVDSNEVEAWLSEKMSIATSSECGKDLDSTDRLISRHNILVKDVENYSVTLDKLREVATDLEKDDNPKKNEIRAKQKAIEKAMDKLKDMMAIRSKNLDDTLKLFQFFNDAANVHSWILEKLKIASSEDCGHDFEHAQALQQKFEEFKMSLSTGKDNFKAVIRLADEIIGENHPKKDTVLDAKKKLNASWTKLEEKIKKRSLRLSKAGQLHKFNLEITETLNMLQEKDSLVQIDDIGQDTQTTESLVRKQEAVLLDLEALNKQIEIIEVQAQDLQQHFPGKIADQIQMHNQFVKKSMQDVVRKAKKAREKLINSADYHRLMAEIESLLSWCSKTMDAVTLKHTIDSIYDAEITMNRLDDLKLEMDSKEDKFSSVVEIGEQMINEGHHATEEIQEKLETLLTKREDLLNTWRKYKQSYTDTYDYHLFCKEANYINGILRSHEVKLTQEESTKCIDQIDAGLRRLESLEKILSTQDEKLSSLCDLGQQLMDSDHFASEKTEDTIERIIEKKSHLYEMIKSNEARLKLSKRIAEFYMDAAELKRWSLEMLALCKDVSELDHSMINTQIRKHKVNTIELNAKDTDFQRLQELGKGLCSGDSRDVSKIKTSMDELDNLWRRLLKSFQKRGQTLETIKNFFQLDRDIDFAQELVIEKERLAASDDVGEDYEHCEIIKCKIDNICIEMEADAKRISLIKDLAKNLPSKGTDFQEEIMIKLRMLYSRWENLKTLVAARKKNLSMALMCHKFNRDALEIDNDIMERIAHVKDLTVPEDLSGAQTHLRKHHALETEVSALKISLETLENDAKTLVQEQPERSSHVQKTQDDILDRWEELVKLVDQRGLRLEAAECLYKFQADVQDIFWWINNVTDRISSVIIGTSMEEAEAQLKMHNEIEIEINIKNDLFSRLEKRCSILVKKHGYPSEAVESKLEQLRTEKKNLENLWNEERVILQQSYQLQKFEQEAQHVEEWLTSREQDLCDDKPGNSLQEAQVLLKKHNNLLASLNAFRQKLDELKTHAKSLIEDNHFASEKINERCKFLVSATDEANKLTVKRRKMLDNSLQYYQFEEQVEDLLSWIKDKQLYANDLEFPLNADLQSEKQKYVKFETEISAKDNEIQIFAAQTEELMRLNYRKEEISERREHIVNSWNQLCDLSLKKRDFLLQKLDLQNLSRFLQEFAAWLMSTETSIGVDEGKDLASTKALLSRHKEIERQISLHDKKISDMKEKLEMSNASNELVDKFGELWSRFSKLKERANTQSCHLQDSLEYHEFIESVEEHKVWMKTKEKAIAFDDMWTNLADIKKKLKILQQVKKDVEAYTSLYERLLVRADEIKSKETQFSKVIENEKRLLQDNWVRFKDEITKRQQRLEDSKYFFKYIADSQEALSWLQNKRTILEDQSSVKDESSAKASLRSYLVTSAELTGFASKVNELRSRCHDCQQKLKSNKEKANHVQEIQAGLEKDYDNLRKLASTCKTKLTEMVNFFHFQNEAAQLEAWISEKSIIASSEKFGKDCSGNEKLLEDFNNFTENILYNEERIVVLNELAQSLIDQEHTDSDLIESRCHKIIELWSNLKALSQNRLECLETAQKLLQFDQEIEESLQWIESKQAELIDLDKCDILEDLKQLRKKQDAFSTDLNGIKQKINNLLERLGYFQKEFPEEYVVLRERVEDVGKAFQTLCRKESQVSDNLQESERIKAFFDQLQDQRKWVEEKSSVIDTEIIMLVNNSSDADKLLSHYHTLENEITSARSKTEKLLEGSENFVGDRPRMSVLMRQEVDHLSNCWKSFLQKFSTYGQCMKHFKDTKILKRDLIDMEEWLNAKQNIVRNETNLSLEDTESRLKQQDDLEKTLVLREKQFQSTLSKLLTLESKLETQEELRTDRNKNASTNKLDSIRSAAKSVIPEEDKMSKAVSLNQNDGKGTTGIPRTLNGNVLTNDKSWPTRNYREGTDGPKDMNNESTLKSTDSKNHENLSKPGGRNFKMPGKTGVSSGERDRNFGSLDQKAKRKPHNIKGNRSFGSTINHNAGTLEHKSLVTPEKVDKTVNDLNVLPDTQQKLKSRDSKMPGNSSKDLPLDLSPLSGSPIQSMKNGLGVAKKSKNTDSLKQSRLVRNGDKPNSSQKILFDTSLKQEKNGTPKSSAKQGAFSYYDKPKEPFDPTIQENVVTSDKPSNHIRNKPKLESHKNTVKQKLDGLKNVDQKTNDQNVLFKSSAKQGDIPLDHNQKKDNISPLDRADNKLNVQHNDKKNSQNKTVQTSTDHPAKLSKGISILNQALGKHKNRRSSVDKKPDQKPLGTTTSSSSFGLDLQKQRVNDQNGILQDGPAGSSGEITSSLTDSSRLLDIQKRKNLNSLIDSKSLKPVTFNDASAPRKRNVNTTSRNTEGKSVLSQIEGKSDIRTEQIRCDIENQHLESIMAFKQPTGQSKESSYHGQTPESSSSRILKDSSIPLDTAGQSSHPSRSDTSKETSENVSVAADDKIPSESLIEEPFNYIEQRFEQYVEPVPEVSEKVSDSNSRRDFHYSDAQARSISVIDQATFVDVNLIYHERDFDFEKIDPNVSHNQTEPESSVYQNIQNSEKGSSVGHYIEIIERPRGPATKSDDRPDFAFDHEGTSQDSDFAFEEAETELYGNEDFIQYEPWTNSDVNIQETFQEPDSNFNEVGERLIDKNECTVEIDELNNSPVEISDENFSENAIFDVEIKPRDETADVANRNLKIDFTDEANDGIYDSEVEEVGSEFSADTKTFVKPRSQYEIPLIPKIVINGYQDQPNFMEQPAFSNDTVSFELKNNAMKKSTHQETTENVDFAGYVHLKQDMELEPGGKKFQNRGWKESYIIIQGNQLMFYNTENHYYRQIPNGVQLDISDAICEIAADYPKKDEVLRLRLSNRAEYLFATEQDDIFGNLLMALTESTGQLTRDDSVSLPPAPPPPSDPVDIMREDFLQRKGSENSEPKDPLQYSSQTAFDPPPLPQSPPPDFDFGDCIPPLQVSQPPPDFDDSDEEDDDVPSPPPISSITDQDIASRKMSLGLLELVGKSPTLSDNCSFGSYGSETSDESNASSFHPDQLEMEEEPEISSGPAKKTNLWLTRPVESPTADEVTPIVPIGQQHLSSHSAYSHEAIPPNKTLVFKGPAMNESEPVHHDFATKPIRSEKKSTFSGQEYSSSTGNSEPTSGSAKAVSLPPKTEKKKKGILSAIFRKKK